MLDSPLQHRLDLDCNPLVGDNVGILKLCQDRGDVLFEFVEKRFLMLHEGRFRQIPDARIDLVGLGNLMMVPGESNCLDCQGAPCMFLCDSHLPGGCQGV